MVTPPTPNPALALTEDNLPAYDKDELVTERALVAKVQECKDAAKVARDQIAQLKADKAGLDKKAPDFKAASKAIDAKVKTMQGIANKKCKLRHAGCVPSDNSKRIPMPQSITDNINIEHKTNVDFEKLSAWEGGAYSQGYIPWWPYLDSAGKPKILLMSDASDAKLPRIKGELGGKPHNKSGATVGVGVDLGQYKADGFFKILDNSNKGADKLDAAALDALKAKIKPYFNMQGGEACKYLRDNPLNLSDPEINFLNKAAHEEVMGIAVKDYESFAKKASNSALVTAPKKFMDLSKEQQTSLLSNAYQYGHAKPELVKAIATGNRALIPSTREHDYLFNSMPAPAPAPPKNP